MITMIVVIFDKRIDLICQFTRAVIIFKKQDVFHRAMVALDFTLGRRVIRSSPGMDNIYCNVRMEERQCLLVIIGGTEGGKKELLALESGFRESELSWAELLLDLKHRGLKAPPKLAIGDGALGFWKALTKVYHNTR
jgi:hypothetical protein